MSILKDVMGNKAGCIFISALLGLGLATMFYKACRGRDCFVIKGVSPGYITKHVWRTGADCHRYTVKTVSCPEDQTDDDKDAIEHASDSVVA